MKMSGDKIRETLRVIFPRLIEGERPWVFDPIKDCPKLSELESVIRETSVETMKLQDCDNYALQLHAAVDVRHQTWAFGEIVGHVYGMFPGIHAMNVCICEDGVYLIEPKTDEIRPASKEILDAFFVRM
jgi:hypothetical protein